MKSETLVKGNDLMCAISEKEEAIREIQEWLEAMDPNNTEHSLFMAISVDKGYRCTIEPEIQKSDDQKQSLKTRLYNAIWLHHGDLEKELRDLQMQFDIL